MSTLFRPLVGASLLWLLAVSSALPVEPTTKPAPGSTLTVQLPEIPPMFYALYQKKAAGAKATIVVEDVGKHDFPASAYPAVRQWLRGPALE